MEITNKEETENKEKLSSFSIIVVAVAVILIVSLCVAYYYFLTNPDFFRYPVVESTNTPVPPLPVVEEKNELATNVIYYVPQDYAGLAAQQGSCSGVSLSYPYRNVYRCKSGTITYDTCFLIEGTNQVLCSTNPLSKKAVLIKLTTALPKLTLPESIPDNFAWFVELEDGKFCAPFSGTLPKTDSDTAYYNCFSTIKDQLDVLLGQLTKGETWTGQRAVLVKSGAKWIIQSQQQVNIKTAWQ